MTKKELQQFLIDKWLHQLTNDGDIIVEDPVDVAKNYDIDIIITDLSEVWENTCGFIRKIEWKFQIFIEQSHHKNRQRFTLAHELWHFFLHMQDSDSRDVFVDNKDCLLFRNGRYSPQEKEANIFAAEYLMPEKEVRKLYNQYGITELLAKWFWVSRIAMAIRIDNIFWE